MILDMFDKNLQIIILFYLAMAMLDVITGYIYCLKDHSWKSAVNLQGLLTKFVTIVTVFGSIILDNLAPFLGIALPFQISIIWTSLLILYEFGSILENSHLMGIDVRFLQKWLDIYKEKIDKDENKEEK